MHPADILKTAIITPFGLLEFLRLTFGQQNAGSTFQRLMDRVLARLSFAFVYLNDIIIASPSVEQHQRDVEEVFHRLQAAGLVINFEKCTFVIPEVDFLGHRVSTSGFTPHPQPGGHHPAVLAARDGQAAAGLPRSFQLLQQVCSSSHEDPPATHRLHAK
jgi:hypothetical protein